MKINESKVKFEDGHFPRDSMVQDGGVFVLTNIFYQPICFNQLIFTLYIIFFFTNHFIHTNDSHIIFFLPTILSIQMTLISLKNVSHRSNLEKSLYPILLPYLHIAIVTLCRLSSSSKLRQKSPTKPSQ